LNNFQIFEISCHFFSVIQGPGSYINRLLYEAAEFSWMDPVGQIGVVLIVAFPARHKGGLHFITGHRQYDWKCLEMKGNIQVPTEAPVFVKNSGEADFEQFRCTDGSLLKVIGIAFAERMSKKRRA
jgi:hypothetical protein